VKGKSQQMFICCGVCSIHCLCPTMINLS
jgi:hypothetical protein